MFSNSSFFFSGQTDLIDVLMNMTINIYLFTWIKLHQQYNIAQYKIYRYIVDRNREDKRYYSAEFNFGC